MARRKVTDAMKIEAFALREERGWSYERIGRRLGVSAGAVSWHRLINGVERPGEPPATRDTVPASGVARGNHIVRGFTPDEDAILLSMTLGGRSNSEIGRTLHRRANSIRGRLATLARRDARAEIAAPSGLDVMPSTARSPRPSANG